MLRRRTHGQLKNVIHLVLQNFAVTLKTQTELTETPHAMLRLVTPM